MTRDLDSLLEAERDAYDDAVSTTHHRSIELDFYRRKDGRPVASVREKFVGGTVEGDLARTPVTFLECEFVDDLRDLDWDDGEYRQFFVKVLDSRFVPALDDWVETVAFTGPLWAFEREGAQVRITAEGPEMNAMGSVRRADVWPGGARATKVIRQLLERAGAQQTDLRIPNLKRTLPRSVTVGVRAGKRQDENGKKKGLGKDKRRKRYSLSVDRKDTYWGEAESIAQALNRDLFANAAGEFVLRHPARRPAVRLFKRHLLSPVIPQLEESDGGQQPNTWIVSGADPKGPKKRPTARVTLPASHVDSAESLAWNGVPREEIVEIQNRQVKTKRQARRLGERKRDESLREVSAVEVSSLPVLPRWRPHALVSVQTETGRTTSVVRSWQLPLGLGNDPLVLGSTIRTRTRIKRKKRKRGRRR